MLTHSPTALTTRADQAAAVPSARRHAAESSAGPFPLHRAVAARRPAGAHPGLTAQLEFAARCQQVLRRAGAHGHRLVTALHLVLDQHRPVEATTATGVRHLSCAECRPDGRDPAAQYPCPSARQAFWALDAVLH